MLPLTENAKSKLEYGPTVVVLHETFQKNSQQKQWAAAVLDLLEELGLGNYQANGWQVGNRSGLLSDELSDTTKFERETKPKK